ncbi:hypothetical protein B0H16DRAFT_1465983 [Mycena metata]|uniref:Uncharacterized protein n=1 Tax=Mycena metata TaxID=1033252 RepID=A0AAD7MYE9_9AGAR|nr:hypothetical protein B0H16DRAFT_1465983 [Mycena metata]
MSDSPFEECVSLKMSALCPRPRQSWSASTARSSKKYFHPCPAPIVDPGLLDRYFLASASHYKVRLRAFTSASQPPNTHTTQIAKYTRPDNSLPASSHVSVLKTLPPDSRSHSKRASSLFCMDVLGDGILPRLHLHPRDLEEIAALSPRLRSTGTRDHLVQGVSRPFAPPFPSHRTPPFWSSTIANQQKVSTTKFGQNGARANARSRYSVELGNPAHKWQGLAILEQPGRRSKEEGELSDTTFRTVFNQGQEW